MIQLTFWKKARIQHSPDDFDEILTVHLKTVKQIPDLVACMPKGTAMISKERSADAKRKGRIINPNNPRYFTEIWREGQPKPLNKPNICPFCGHSK